MSHPLFSSPSMRQPLLALGLALGLTLGAAMAAPPAWAAEPVRGIEQLLAAAQQDKRGVTLYVGGQAISGAVTRIEAGQWVELRSQQFARIVVRLDRVDGVAAP